MSVVVISKGGPGSGHRGHRGRPGLQGGGLPDGAGAAPKVDDKSNDWINYADSMHNTYERKRFGDGWIQVSTGNVSTMGSIRLGKEYAEWIGDNGDRKYSRKIQQGEKLESKEDYEKWLTEKFNAAGRNIEPTKPPKPYESSVNDLITNGFEYDEAIKIQDALELYNATDVKVEYIPEDRPFELGGKEYTTGAYYNESASRIVICTESCKRDIGYTVPHEIVHHKFDAIMREGWANKGDEDNPSWAFYKKIAAIRDDPSWAKEYSKKGHAVSNYAGSYWTAWHTDKSGWVFERAINETLAEVARTIHKGNSHKIDQDLVTLYYEFDAAYNSFHPSPIKKEKKPIVVKGGPGSGFYGHAGRPGEVGGALPGKGITNKVIGNMPGSRGTAIYDFQDASNMIKEAGIVAVSIKDGSITGTNGVGSHSMMLSEAGRYDSIDNYVRFTRQSDQKRGSYYEVDTAFAGVVPWTDTGSPIPHDEFKTMALDNIYKALDKLHSRGLPSTIPILIWDRLDIIQETTVKHRKVVVVKGGPGSGFHGHPGGHYVGGKLVRGGSRSFGGATDVWGGDEKLKQLANDYYFRGVRFEGKNLEPTEYPMNEVEYANYMRKSYYDLQRKLKDGEKDLIATEYTEDWDIVKRYELNSDQMREVLKQVAANHLDRIDSVRKDMNLPPTLSGFEQMLIDNGVDLSKDTAQTEVWTQIDGILEKRGTIQAVKDHAMVWNENEYELMNMIYEDELKELEISNLDKYNRVMDYMIYGGSILREQGEFEAKHQIALGNTTEKYVHDVLGIYATAQGEEGWQDMPNDLWHAATNADAIAADQLRSRVELDMRSGPGLGGGESDTISFTNDAMTGQMIERALHEANLVASGKVNVTKMLELARDGGGGVGNDWSDKLMGNFTGNGPKVEVTSDSPLTWKNLPWKLKMMLSAEAGSAEAMESLGGYDKYLEAVWDVYHFNYAGARDRSGGFMDPLFFGTDFRALGAMDSNKFKTLHYHPRSGTKGYKVSGLGEWRTVGGDTVELMEIIDFYEAGDFEAIMGVIK